MSSPFFCQIAEAFFSGLANGTSPTTYSPSDTVTREQMAAFITRTQDSALRRGSRRAALKQWATPAALPMTGRTTVGIGPQLVASDGADLWVADLVSNDVKRVRASDGKVLETWTGASAAVGVLVARGRVYVTGQESPGTLYVIDPSTAAGAVTTLNNGLGDSPQGITTDGSFIWTANSGGSVSRVDPDSGVRINFFNGFTTPMGILFDGLNIWVTDFRDNELKKLDSSGNIVQSVAVGPFPLFPVFDGSNIWVPNGGGDSITVVRARDGLVLATLTGNGLRAPQQAAFDGRRILVTNANGDSVSLWNASDLTPIGTFAARASAAPFTAPFGVCSDGINFWITLRGTDQLARF
jgi:DNA-binding beta-propeller fold protein YncE